MKLPRIPLAWTLLALALIASGCIQTLHSLYTDEDVVFDPGLVGLWKSENGKETWDFAKEGDNAYKLTHIEASGKVGTFAVHLLKVGNHLFLDLHPDNDPYHHWDRGGLYKYHFIPVHTFIKVKLDESSLSMSFPNPGWLKKLLEEDPKALKHERLADGQIVVTAPTGELQAFVRKHADSEDAFNKPAKLKRE